MDAVVVYVCLVDANRWAQLTILMYVLRGGDGDGGRDGDSDERLWTNTHTLTPHTGKCELAVSLSQPFFFRAATTKKPRILTTCFPSAQSQAHTAKQQVLSLSALAHALVANFELKGLGRLGAAADPFATSRLHVAFSFLNSSRRRNLCAGLSSAEAAMHHMINCKI